MLLNTAQNLYDPHLISVADYHKMAETGILNETARVELIIGEIIDMAPIGSRHAAIVNLFTRMLVMAVGDDVIVSIQNPVILGDFSEPEPDIALLKAKVDNYENALPEADDILLLIEVADSTLQYDRQIKAPLYAQFGIAELWLMDVQKNSITLFQKPEKDNYSMVTTLDSPTRISPLLLPNVSLDIQKIIKR